MEDSQLVAITHANCVALTVSEHNRASDFSSSWATHGNMERVL